MFKLLGKFKNDESGAVTVDWVVLTAAIVGMGIAVITSVSGGTNALAGKVSSAVTDSQIGPAAAEEEPADPPA